MPLMHCMECHHEWESTDEKSLCGWCGAAGYVLKDKTGLERLCENLPEVMKKVKKVVDHGSES